MKKSFNDSEEKNLQSKTSHFEEKLRHENDCLKLEHYIKELENANMELNKQIEERAKAEESVAKSEAWFKAIFNATSEAIFVHDAINGKILNVNQSMLDMYEYDSYDEVYEISVDDLNITNEPYTLQDAQIHYQKAVELGLHTFEWKGKKKSGKIFDIEVTLRVCNIDEKQIIITVVRDITARKNAEQKLKESQNLFQTLANHAPVGIFRTNEIGETTYVNPKWEELSGLTLQQAIGDGWLNVVHPNDRARLQAHWQNDVNRSKNSVAEYRFLKPDGAEVWVMGTAINLTHDNLSDGYIGTITDITERKQKEQKLLLRSEYFIRISQYSIALSSTKDAETIGYIIQSFKSIFEIKEVWYYDFDEAKMELNFVDTSLDEKSENTIFRNVGNRMFLQNNAIAQADLELFMNIGIGSPSSLFELFGSGLSETLSNTLTKMVNVGWFQQMVLVNSNRFLGMMVFAGFRNQPPAIAEELQIFCEITANFLQRKKSEVQLRQSESKFRAMVESSSDMIWETNLHGVYTYVSPQIEALLGYTPQEVINKSPFALVSNDTRSELQQKSNAIVDSRKPFSSLQNSFVHKLGHTVYVETSGMPAFDEHGNLVGYRGVSRDITRRKQAEQEVANLNHTLEQKVIDRTAQLEVINKELEAFAYSVSHDLRSPLRAIEGFSSILAEEHSEMLDAEGHRLCSLIAKNTQKMDLLINDLLRFSRASRAELVISSIDSNKLIQSILAEMNSQIENPSVTFKIHALLPTIGDIATIRQVWINLISNAIKFSSKQGNPIIEISSYSEAQNRVFVVSDNGVGFNMEYADKLFGVFQRFHSSKQFEGTGVGLAIVQRIILKHGGKVWAQSSEGNGAKFFFSLPIV